MATTKQVRTAWLDYVWSKPMAKNYTDNIFQFDVTVLSQQDFAGLMYQQEINFFTAVNLKIENTGYQGVNHIQYRHLVKIDYYLSVSLNSERGENHNLVIDRLSDLESDIRADSVFGKDWNGTVDYWQVADTKEPSLVRIGDSFVWRGSYLYEGFELVNC